MLTSLYKCVIIENSITHHLTQFSCQLFIKEKSLNFHEPEQTYRFTVLTQYFKRNNALIQYFFL